MKKKAFLLASMGALACTVGVTALAVGGANQLDIFPVKAEPTGHSFTFNADTDAGFINQAVEQTIDVTTGVSSPITTRFTPSDISSVTFGGERFVEAHPNKSEDAYYSLTIGINNLTKFAIHMGVINDGGGYGYEDVYNIELHDKNGDNRKHWYYDFGTDGDGDGTKHIVWDKKEDSTATYTVVEVLIELYFDVEDLADASLYVESLSLTWEC